MTSFRMTRCQHCLTRYRYQVSGHGCFDEPNNDRYCRDCWEKIRETLAKIPVRFQMRWIPCTDISVDELMRIEKERMETVKKAGGIPIRRLTVPAFDLSDYENNNLTGIVTVNGKRYCYSAWTKSGKSEVSVLMQYDMLDKSLSPWLDD